MTSKENTKIKVLITGGSGFIGTNLCEFLQSNGYDWLNFDVAEPKIYSHKSNWKKVDILDFSSFSRELTRFKPHVIMHLAARTDLRGTSQKHYEVNTVGTENLIKSILLQNPQPQKTIFFSSRLVFDIKRIPKHEYDYSASTAYGTSKVEMEQIILKNSEQLNNWTIARPTSIWGPWFETPYKDFFDQVKSRRFLKVKGFNPVKSFGFVDNLVLRVVHIGIEEQEALSKKATFLADLKPLSVNDWADLISLEFGTKKALTVNRRVLKYVATLGDIIERIVPGRFPLTTFRLDNLLTDMVYNLDDLADATFPDPTSVSEGVHKTVNWYVTSKG